MALLNPRLSGNRLHSEFLTDESVNPRMMSAVGTRLKKVAPYWPHVVRLSQYLWDSTADLRERIVDTYFVKGIGDGTLNPTAFGGYMVQDSVYCSMAKDSIDIAASKATDHRLKDYLRKESDSYGSYASKLFKKWHIHNADGIQLGEACLSYAKYEEFVAKEKDTIYFILSMIPCMKLWPWLGQQIQGGKHGVYTDWYIANFNPAYDGYKDLDAFVDTAQQDGTIEEEMALQVYTRCMEGEFHFFDGVEDMS